MRVCTEIIILFLYKIEIEKSVYYMILYETIIFILCEYKNNCSRKYLNWNLITSAYLKKWTKIEQKVVLKQ